MIPLSVCKIAGGTDRERPSYLRRVALRERRRVSRAHTYRRGERTRRASYVVGTYERDTRRATRRLSVSVFVHKMLELKTTLFRYRQLSNLHAARDAMILSYTSFVARPLRQHCAAHENCVDTIAENLLHRSNQGRTTPILYDNDGVPIVTVSVIGAGGAGAQLIRELRTALLVDDMFVQAPTRVAAFERRYKFDMHAIDPELTVGGDLTEVRSFSQCQR